MVHSLPLHYISYSPPTSLFLSLSLFSSVCLSANTCPLFTLFLFRSSARKVAERERGKRKGRHRMIAVLN